MAIDKVFHQNYSKGRLNPAPANALGPASLQKVEQKEIAELLTRATQKKAKFLELKETVMSLDNTPHDLSPEVGHVVLDEYESSEPSWLKYLGKKPARLSADVYADPTVAPSTIIQDKKGESNDHHITYQEDSEIPGRYAMFADIGYSPSPSLIPESDYFIIADEPRGFLYSRRVEPFELAPRQDNTGSYKFYPSSGMRINASTAPSLSNNAKALLEATAVEAAELEASGSLGNYEPGEIILRTKPGTLPSDSIASLVEDFGADVLDKFDNPNTSTNPNDGEFIRLRLMPRMSVAQAIAAMSQDTRVEFVEPNNTYGLPDRANGALLLSNSEPGDNYPIAILGQGVPEGRLWTNPREVPNDGIDNDQNGVKDDVHGYNAYADDGDILATKAYPGQSPQASIVDSGIGSEVMAVNLFSESGQTNAVSIIRGIQYAKKMGARVTTTGWGDGRTNRGIESVLDALNQ